MVQEEGVGIQPLEGEDGVRVIDRIERRSIELRTTSAVNPVPVGGNIFPYPVDTAVSFAADQLTLPESPAVHLYDCEGTPIDDLGIGTRRELHGRTVVQLESTLKLYLRVDRPLTIEKQPGTTRISTTDSGRIHFGARRHHDRPVGTITTTDDTCDVMRAISHLGSAVKTSSPRRSYPSLRGHPPAIELGTQFSVPEMIDPPDHGIRVEIPADLGAVYVAAPLAHYLPAELVAGSRRRLVTKNGFIHDLESERGYEAEIERVLKQTFFLDCVTRDEITSAVTVEQERVDDRLPFSVESVRELSPAERIEQYLETPYDAIGEFVPNWKLVAHVEPTPQQVELVPYLTDDLAAIRTPSTTRDLGPKPARVGDGALRRVPTSSSRGHTEMPGGGSETYVEVAPADSVEQAWVGDGIPIGASKAVAEAYRNRIGREPSDDRLKIVVVCNDEGMLEEREAVGDVYGSREDLPFDVTIHENLTTGQFRDVLASEVNFLHYVGHIDEEGFECADGSLAASELETVAVDSFVLNACRSYEQGLALIEQGAVGGVVTLDQVINSGAIRVGKAMARLLNRGFPLRPALKIARKRSIIGNQYLVVGDGNFDIAPIQGLGPRLLELHTGDGEYELAVTSYPTRFAGLGSIYRPDFDRPDDALYLGSSKVSSFTLAEEELRNYLDVQVKPVVFDEELTWSDQIDLEDDNGESLV